MNKQEFENQLATMKEANENVSGSTTIPSYNKKAIVEAIEYLIYSIVHDWEEHPDNDYKNIVMQDNVDDFKVYIQQIENKWGSLSQSNKLEISTARASKVHTKCQQSKWNS